MRKTLLLILFYSFANFSYSQHSKKLKSLMSSIKPIDTYTVNERYKNGNPKEKGNVLMYNYKEYAYLGKVTEYYRNKNIHFEILCDSLGYPLNYRAYDMNGYLLLDRVTTKIETKANTLGELFNFRENYLVYAYEKHYTYSMKLDTIYLCKEGANLNGKKTGLWKKYNYKGVLKKEKEYK